MKIQRSFFLLTVLTGMAAISAGMGYVGKDKTRPFVAQGEPSTINIKEPSAPKLAARFQPLSDESFRTYPAER